MKFNRRFAKRIPGVLPGILFLCLGAACAAQTNLVTDLFDEGDWRACRREALRTLADDPLDATARFHADLAAARLRDADGPQDSATGFGSRLAGWIVGFYRTQIAPAIGARCSLEPSCSRYFLEAGRKHGLLAFPMQGDRLVREPGVVLAVEKPVQVRGKTRFADPVSDHDWWMKFEEE